MESALISVASRAFHRHSSFYIKATEESPANSLSPGTGGQNLYSTAMAPQYRKEKQHIGDFQVNLLSKHTQWEAEASVSRMQHYPSLWVCRRRI